MKQLIKLLFHTNNDTHKRKVDNKNHNKIKFLKNDYLKLAFS